MTHHRFDVEGEAKKVAEVAKVAAPKTYTDEEIDEVISAGGVVTVWSKVLNDKMRWVKGADEVAKLASIPGPVVYTLAELDRKSVV